MSDPILGWLLYVDQLLTVLVPITEKLVEIFVGLFIIVCAGAGMWMVVRKPKLGFNMVCRLAGSGDPKSVGGSEQTLASAST